MNYQTFCARQSMAIMALLRAQEREQVPMLVECPKCGERYADAFEIEAIEDWGECTLCDKLRLECAAAV